jgi:hypothetical protein
VRLRLLHALPALAVVAVAAIGCGGSVVVDGTSGTAMSMSSGTEGGGTGGSSTNPSGGSCDLTNGTSVQHRCQTFAPSIGGQQSVCAAAGGTWVASCPAGALGTCTLGPVGVVSYYLGGDVMSAAQAQQVCMTGGGTWN